MKLEINLADREEIAAAVPLLQLILNGTSEASQADPAQVFGGAAAPAPLPPSAPSIAGVEASAIAPVAPLGSSTMPPVPSMPVPTVTVDTAPMAPAAPLTPASNVELDSKGLPWDERIHASTKSKIASGEWKAKRGINDPSLVQRVEAELRQRMAGAVAPAAPQAPQAPVAPAAPAMDAAQVFAPQAPAALEVPAAPVPFVPPTAPSAPVPPPAPSASADPTTFEQLMPRITAAVMAQQLPPTAVGQACTAFGLTSVVALQTSPQHVPSVWQYLKQQYPALV